MNNNNNNNEKYIINDYKVYKLKMYLKTFEKLVKKCP